MKKSILLILLIVPLIAYATAQFSENLTYNGENVSLRETPLTAYFRLTQQGPNFEEYFGGSCSACWRGYVGTWVIEDDKLFLTKIQDWNEKKDYPLENLFPDYDEKRIFASWYSGYLEIPKGAELHYVHMGFDSVYEDNLLLQVDSGKIVGKVVISQRAVAYINRLYGGDERIENLEIDDLPLKESLALVLSDFNSKLTPHDIKAGLNNVEVLILPKELPDKRITIELSGLDYLRTIEFICKSAGFEPSFSHRGDIAIISLNKIKERIVEEDDPENKEVISNSEYLRYLISNYDIREQRMSGYDFNDKNARWRGELYSGENSKVEFHISLTYKGTGMTVLAEDRPRKQDIEAIVNDIIRNPVIGELWEASTGPALWIRSHPAFDDDDEGLLSDKLINRFSDLNHDLSKGNDWAWIQVRMSEGQDWISLQYSEELQLVIIQSAYLPGDLYKRLHHLFPIDPFSRGLNLFKTNIVIDSDMNAVAVKYED